MIDSDLALAKDVNQETNIVLGRMEAYRDLLFQVNGKQIKSMPQLVEFINKQRDEAVIRLEELEQLNNTIRRKYE